MLVLASKSPRRQQILRDAGIPFVVRQPMFPSSVIPAITSRLHSQRLAQEKAFAVPISTGEIVLGADTVVVVDSQVLEKPSDAGDATRMLGFLSGREHEVITGICLRSDTRIIVDIATTRVRFVPLTGAEIEAYVASGEPMDKAGAYAIQGLASKFVDRVEGSYSNVVGLPVSLVYRRLKEIRSQ